MNANRLFELVAAHAWPLIRPFVRISRRCRTCIISERDAPLIDGRCPACHRGMDQPEVPASGADQTKQAFDEAIRSQLDERRYHAVLLLSGGKDSAYILDRLSCEYPALRMLCVVVNNGFMGPHALEGAERLATRYGCDLLTVNSRIEQFAQTLRQAFLDLDGQGAYGVVDKADGDLIFDCGRDVAMELRIPLMLGGLSWVQLKRIFAVDGFEMERRAGVRELYPLAAWRTGEQEILARVRTARLLPSGSASPIVSNSELVLAMSVVDVLNRGYSSFEPEFAQLVREGKTDRRTWLHVFELLEFATHRGFLDKQAQQGLARLGLTINDVVKGNHA